MLPGLADAQENRIENFARINQKHVTELIESVLSIIQMTQGKASNEHF